jgi:hypothetical protein
MRRRIRSLTGSAEPAPARSGPAGPARSRPLSRPAPAAAPPRTARLAQPDQAGPSGGDTFEWTTRKSDGPTDSALYSCSCGYRFTARVATTVSCPNCGTGQAW